MPCTVTKAIRIMAEYASNGIWPVPHLLHATMDGFRISPDLYARLQRWVRRYYDLDRADGYTGLCQAPEWEAWNIEGYAIAFEVKAELPNWRVFYVDETLIGLGLLKSVHIEIPDRLT
jgi:hypothetical protein